MLVIIGGTYYEECEVPQSWQLYGSGLRASCALANKGFDIKFYSCIGKDDLKLANVISDNFLIQSYFTIIPKTITWQYYHPLSRPVHYPNLLENTIVELPSIESDCVLYYGLKEANVVVNACYVVYDPQNGVPFTKTGSFAEHLAIILNFNEALFISGLNDTDSLVEIGSTILRNENADVVIIKNGVKGAFLINKSKSHEIPIFKTSSVWPIGSGDIFSAVFSWKWMVDKLSSYEAALWASKYTAQYCESRVLPLPLVFDEREALPKIENFRKIYLAGPFFNIAQRWLIDELRELLIDFGNDVFSPFHDVGMGSSTDVTKYDLEALRKADVILAVIDGWDAGTLFEVGFAKAINKRVVILAENVFENDLTMLIGSGCEITKDISSAVYFASW